MSAELPFNKLSPAEAERLALLMEEMAEAQQVIGKILRHGYSSCHPESRTPNRTLLEMELGHVMHCIVRMINSGDVVTSRVVEYSEEKAQTIGKWLHHQ